MSQSNESKSIDRHCNAPERRRLQAALRLSAASGAVWRESLLWAARGLSIAAIFCLIGCQPSDSKTASSTDSAASAEGSADHDHAGHDHTTHDHSAGGAGSGNAETDLGSVLSPERRADIWQLEHIAFELQKRWGEPMLASLLSGETERLAKSLLPEADMQLVSEATTIEEHPGFLLRSSFATQGQANSGQAENLEVTAASGNDLALFIASLQSVAARFASGAQSRLEILSLKPTEETGDLYEVEIRWSLQGVSTSDSSPLAIVSRTHLLCRVASPQSIDSSPFITSWREQERQELSAPQTWFEEITSLHRLERQGIIDNRHPRTPAEQTMIYRFQMALEDFNLDGRPDLAVAAINDPPRLLRQQPNQVFLQRAGEAGIVIPRPTASMLACWIDIDQDRDVDLIIGDNVYRNDDGLFEKVTESCGILIRPYCMGGAVADYDLDGDLDLYLVYHQQMPPQRNLTSWLDGENCGRYNELWQNQGDGTFIDVTAQSRAGGGGRLSNSATWAYLNDDLYPDLMITNEFARDVFLINQKDGTFTDVTRDLGADSLSMSTGLVAGDMNGDGFTDFYMAGRHSVTGQRILGYLNDSDHTPALRDLLAKFGQGGQLWTGSNQGLVRANPTRNAVEIGWGFGPALADLDNDGRLDLLVANGMQSYEPTDPEFSSPLWQSIVIAPEQRTVRVSPKGTLDEGLREPWNELPASLFGQRVNLSSFEHNRVLLAGEALDYRDISAISGLDIDADARTIIPCDLNRDGAIDVVVGSVGGGLLRAFRNRNVVGNWLGVQLAGKQSNAYGIGARVTVRVGERTMVRDLFPASSFMGQGPAELHFGLGDAQVIDQLEIRWPSGHVTKAEQVPVNQWTRWNEATDDFVALPPLEFEPQNEDQTPEQ